MGSGWNYKKEKPCKGCKQGKAFKKQKHGGFAIGAALGAAAGFAAAEVLTHPHHGHKGGHGGKGHFW